jgi:methanogenic corrinoid protein MtbC1
MSGSMQGFESRQSGGTARPTLVTARTRSRERLRLLAEAIEGSIVPRLVAGYDADAEPRALPRAQSFAPDKTIHSWRDGAPSRDAPAHDPAFGLEFSAIPQAAIDLAMLAVGGDEGGVTGRVAGAVAEHGLEPVCLDLLAPAARHLGHLWDEDIVSFADVTIGLMRLQSALLAVTIPSAAAAAATGCAIHPAASPRRTALLAPAQGDQHTFGLKMVAGSLERAGWAVTQLADGAPETIEAALRSQWFGVLGVSAGSGAKLQALNRMLPRLRAMSRNPDLGVLVGGPLFVAEPGLAAEIGADSTASDGPHAVEAAEALIAPRRVPRTATG